MRQHDLARARAIVERTRTAQGLDPRITDPAILHVVTAVFEVADPEPDGEG